MRGVDRRPVVAVKLHPVGRSRTAAVDPAGGTPRPGDPVVVQTESGAAMAVVVRQPSAVTERRRPRNDDELPLARPATRDDVVVRLQQEQREREAFRVAALKIREHGLPMKLTRAEHLFDASKIVFYFTADGRVDFRELVRDLATDLGCRVEMRQIGVRDEARLIGGYGTCGRPLCCTAFLTSFEPVSIKMARQQDLSLNPSKLSGLCGRLKCCLRYELPNAAGVVHGGCGSETGCHCGTGGCSSGCTAARLDARVSSDGRS